MATEPTPNTLPSPAVVRPPGLPSPLGATLTEAGLDTVYDDRDAGPGEKLTEAGALDVLFADFDRQLKERGYLAMGGQIVDATLVQAPRQRMTQEEKDQARAGKTAAQIWPDKPAKAAQKDTQARWM